MSAVALASAFIIPGIVLAAASGYSLFGDATLVSPGFNSPTAAQIRSSSAAPGYGGIDFSIPAGLTVADLNKLSTDYQFTAGSCGGGAPRFQVIVTTPSGSKNISVYIGPPPNYTGCPQNIWSNTGNLLQPASLVDATQLGGSFYEPYFQVQAAYGSYPVTGVQLVTDASWFFSGGAQTMQADNVMINDATFTFESADSCKNGGWQSFTAAPGPFKNQGACVSYFEHQK